MTKKFFAPWTDAEDAIIRDAFLQIPLASNADISGLAHKRLPHRTVGAIMHRLSQGGRFAADREIAAKAARPEPVIAPIDRAQIQVVTPLPNGDTIAAVSIPRPSFRLEIGNREETRPAERRSAPFRKETRYEMVKRIIQEMRA